MSQDTVQYFDNALQLTQNVKRYVKETDIVLDIGPGIYPYNVFIPKVHILVEPWGEYVEILRSRFEKDSKVLIFNCDALTFAKSLDEKSIDSAVLIDVIEHMEKEVGLQLIEELERITREQIIIFTPLGFMPQHVNLDRTDRWGLSGGEFQEHLSGWTPSDFVGSWSFYICESFHQFDDSGEPLRAPFGAFYAIKNVSSSTLQKIEPYSGTFFRKTPKDLKIEELTSDNGDLRLRLDQLTSDNGEIILKISLLIDENKSMINSTSWMVTAPFRVLSHLVQRAIGIKNL